MSTVFDVFKFNTALCEALGLPVDKVTALEIQCSTWDVAVNVQLVLDDAVANKVLHLVQSAQWAAEKPDEEMLVPSKEPIANPLTGATVTTTDGKVWMIGDPPSPNVGPVSIYEAGKKE